MEVTLVSMHIGILGIPDCFTYMPQPDVLAVSWISMDKPLRISASNRVLFLEGLGISFFRTILLNTTRFQLNGEV